MHINTIFQSPSHLPIGISKGFTLQNSICLSFTHHNYYGHTESHEQRRITGNSATSDDWVSFGRWRQLSPYLWVRYGISSLHHVTTKKPYKMANNHVSFRQHAVIEFLVKEEIPAADIHHRIQCVYGDLCMGASSVRWWVKHFKDGNTSTQDKPRSSHPRTASTEPNKKRVDEVIKEDRCVTLDTTATKLGIGHNAVREMIGSLDFRKKGHPAAR